MTILFYTLLGLGLLTMLVGGVLTLVAAFRQSLLWGFAYLFVPLVSLVFLVVHWAEAKKGFFVSLAGTALFFAPLVASTELRSGFISALRARTTQARPAPPAPDLTAQIATARSGIEQLEGQFAQTSAPLTQRYQALAATRHALKPGDAAAVTRFNAEAAAYQQETTAQRQLQQAIATARQDLDALLAARAKQPAAPAAKKVVMYSTAQCPACDQAKRYFTQRGVTFEVRDVQQSKTAAEEFQRLGGRGVPLILVGEKRLDGFSPQELDRML